MSPYDIGQTLAGGLAQRLIDLFRDYEMIVRLEPASTAGGASRPESDSDDALFRTQLGVAVTVRRRQNGR